MFEAFDALFAIIETTINFITGFVQNLVFVIGQIGKGFGVAGMAALHLPNFIKIFVTAFIAYCIIINVLHLGD